MERMRVSPERTLLTVPVRGCAMMPIDPLRMLHKEMLLIEMLMKNAQESGIVV